MQRGEHVRYARRIVSARRLLGFPVVACVFAVLAFAAPAQAWVGALPPTSMTQEQLKAFAASVHHPVYWVGPSKGYSYEVTETQDGRVYVRYLPAGVKAGDPRAGFLVVGTYPLKDAFAATQAAAKRLGSVTVKLRNGVTGFQSKTDTSFYLAYPKANFQIEVYSSTRGRAQRFAISGKVTPVA